MSDSSPAARRDYQDGLRAIGAWLDARGYQDIRIVEAADGLIVQARAAAADPDAPFETIRFVGDRLPRLRRAARADRAQVNPLPA